MAEIDNGSKNADSPGTLIMKYKVRANAALAASPILYTMLRSKRRSRDGMVTMTIDIPENEQWMMDLAVALLNDDTGITEYLSADKFVRFVRFLKEYEMCKIVGSQGDAWLSRITLLSGTFESLWVYLELGNKELFSTTLSKILEDAYIENGKLLDFMGHDAAYYGITLPECLIDAIKIERRNYIRLTALAIKRYIDDTNDPKSTCGCLPDNTPGCRNTRIGHAVGVAMEAGVAAGVFAPSERALEESLFLYNGGISHLWGLTQRTKTHTERSIGTRSAHRLRVRGRNTPRCLWLDDRLRGESDELSCDPKWGPDGNQMWAILKDNMKSAAEWELEFRKPRRETQEVVEV